MKILYLCSDSGIPVLGRKGASIHVRSLVEAFSRAGHSVVVATPLLTKSPWQAPASLDAQLLHVPPAEGVVAAIDSVRSYTDALGANPPLASELRRILYNQQLEAKLLRRFKDDPPDFIYERAAVYGTAGAAVARALNVPLYVELNAPLGLEQATYRGSNLPDLARLAELATLTAAERVLVVSAPLRDYVTSLGVPAERVEVIPNAIDPALFSPGRATPDGRARWQIDSGPVIGFVGGLRPWHGVRTLPALLERLVPKYPGVRLVIVGDGPLRGEIADAFVRRQLAAHVVFTGALDHAQIPEVVRQFDVALAPYDESQHLFYFSPLKLFEYMGCGVPVVAAALGQIAELITHDQNGVLYAPGDLEGLAGACESLLAEPDRRERLGRAGAETVHARFTWSANARRIVELAQQAHVRLEAVA